MKILLICFESCQVSPIPSGRVERGGKHCAIVRESLDGKFIPFTHCYVLQGKN